MPELMNRSPVTEVPAADSHTARTHFEGLLAFETDCWDVHAALASARPGFVLLDVRTPELFAAGHIAGAVNIPRRKLNDHNLEPYAPDTLFVVYCAGPHCNGADKGALRLATLGRPVKKMIGGVTGWLDEGFDLTTE
jgi:rhodanese-related sulfurtransferase